MTHRLFKHHSILAAAAGLESSLHTACRRRFFNNCFCSSLFSPAAQDSTSSRKKKRHADATIDDGSSREALLYLPSGSYSRSGSSFLQFGGNVRGDAEFSSLVDELAPEKMVDFIVNADARDVERDRGTPRLVFSLSPLNCTDKSKQKYEGYTGPKGVSRHDNEIGWLSENRTADLSSAMITMSLMMDLVTEKFGLEGIMADMTRNDKFSHELGHLSGREDYNRNKAEGISISISTDTLTCHVDHFNDWCDGYQWNASYTGMFPNPAVTVSNGEPAYLRLHVGIYSRRICGRLHHKIKDTNGLAEDIDGWLKVLDANCPQRVHYSGATIPDSSEADANGLAYRPVHINKLTYYSFYALEILEWMQYRQKKIRPVTQVEILDAIYTTVWTSVDEG